ncbi:MAG: YggS family pyridoxal phosphate-dependent enzyme [Flavobacteriales bacterium]
MTAIRPFQALRPARDKAHLVASRSYVTYSVRELREKLKGNPYTFLHIIHPDLGSRKVHKMAGTARYKLVREAYEQFKEEGLLLRDDVPAFYVYRQISHGHAYWGVLAAVAMEEYLKGNIRIHEHTLSSREATFAAYLSETAIHAEPVLLFHPDHADVAAILQGIMEARPEYDFTTTDKIRHQLWLADRPADIEALTRCYRDIPRLYIADGHHRCASSATLYKKRKDAGEVPANDHPAASFLAFIIAESNLRIYPFSRLVRDLQGVSHKTLCGKLGWHFHIRKADYPVEPTEKGSFGMYLAGSWYELEAINTPTGLDADLLHNTTLAPLLGIGDPKQDKRISYMEGPRGLKELMQEVDSGRSAIAFTMCPVDVRELREVADRGACMPPKSTWIEPKLRSGLVVHELHKPIYQNYLSIRRHLPDHVTLVAVSKFQTVEAIREAYEIGIRDFGENYVQELEEKRHQLPADIRWHFIGHLQRNKVKYIAPYIHCIHSVDSLSLWEEISKQAERNNRKIHVLAQLRIAEEETKFGLKPGDLERFCLAAIPTCTRHAPLAGLMAMASFTDDEDQVRSEFHRASLVFSSMKRDRYKLNPEFTTLSIGMSGDWKIAVQEGSTMVRLGTSLFGARQSKT